MNELRRTWVVLFLAIVKIVVAITVAVTVVVIEFHCVLPRISRVTAGVDIVRARAFLVFLVVFRI